MKKPLIFLSLLSFLAPIVVLGIVYEEKDVKCISLRMYKDANGGPHAIAECDTYDSSNSPLVHVNAEIWENLSQAQKDALSSAFAAMDSCVREVRNIPAPETSPSPVAETAKKKGK